MNADPEKRTLDERLQFIEESMNPLYFDVCSIAQARRQLLKLYNRTEALKGCIDALERCERGHTHWEGCEKQHPSCAAIRKAREALDGD